LWLQTAGGDAKNQRWIVGANGSILLNSPTCSQYKLGNLAISAIKDDDIENMMDNNVYVSIANPASGMVRIVASPCSQHSFIAIRH
jgi:hypothetical protein